jgi:hypothetical protein
MKKILDLLEQKVQWIVLGLAVLYVGYVVYIYIWTPPVIVSLDGEEVAPGEIDAKVMDKVGEPLKLAMSDARVRQPATAPSYVATFKATMGYEGDKPASWPNAPIVMQSLPPIPDDLGPTTGQPNPLQQGVAELPQVRSARITGISKGVTNVLPAAAAAAPAAGAAPAGKAVDKTWVSIKFEIDPKELGSAWDEAKVPQTLGDTVFLAVKVERQERRPDGTWGNPTTVPSLSIHQHDPVPADKAPIPQIAAFLDWAKTHQKEILQPEFYTRIKGDEWVVPGSAASAVAAAPAFDRSKYPTGTRDELLKQGLDQKQIDEVMEYRRTHPTPRPAPRGAAPRGTPAPRGRGNAPPPDAGAIEFQFAPQIESGSVVNFQAAPEEAPAPNPEEAANAAAGANPAEAAQAIAAQFPVPTGDFDPRKWTGAGPTIVGWAHDDTALPGHIYQYRVTYVLKNPLYFAAQAVKNPNTSTIFSIPSAPSAWSESVEIPSTLNYFIARPSVTTGTVTWDVYRNQGGVQNWKSFEVTAGDMIGANDGGVDYTTGETMLDVREDPRTGTYVLLMDQNGEVHRRDFKDDQSNPKYAQLKQAAAKR